MNIRWKVEKMRCYKHEIVFSAGSWQLRSLSITVKFFSGPMKQACF